MYGVTFATEPAVSRDRGGAPLRWEYEQADPLPYTPAPPRNRYEQADPLPTGERRGASFFFTNAGADRPIYAAV